MQYILVLGSESVWRSQWNRISIGALRKIRFTTITSSHASTVAEAKTGLDLTFTSRADILRRLTPATWEFTDGFIYYFWLFAIHGYRFPVPRLHNLKRPPVFHAVKLFQNETFVSRIPINHHVWNSSRPDETWKKPGGLIAMPSIVYWFSMIQSGRHKGNEFCKGPWIWPKAVIAHVAREMTQVRLLLKRTKRLMLVANLSRARLVFWQQRLSSKFRITWPGRRKRLLTTYVGVRDIPLFEAYGSDHVWGIRVT
jgi:hypothetical protein